MHPVPAASDQSAALVARELAALNAQQLRAVTDGAAGVTRDTEPLLVIAGAGSGKTRMLAARVAYLIAHGADPSRILLLAFSRRAAADLERRAGQSVQRMLGASASRSPMSLPWAGTFHGIGARLLREYAPRIGLPESFTIHDRGDSEDLLAIVRHELGLSATKIRFPAKATCLAIYSRVVNASSSLGDALAETFPWCARWRNELASLFDAYVGAKQAQHVLDFDDLLLYWSQMAAEPALGREIGARFDHILVDEYQDTNRLQTAILVGMKPDGAGVTVVGDDAQSIYSFRAATVRNILDFPAQFARPARVVTLDRNYRSTQPILDASNAVIALARERYTKSLWTERTGGGKPRLVAVRDETEQARCVAERVLAALEAGIALRSQAVLFRSSSHSASLELELARRAIPFVKYGGLRFLEAAHVKDVLSILRFAQNPRSRMAGFRAVQLIDGVGSATARRLLDAMVAAPNPATALQAFLPPQAAVEWGAFVALHRALTEAKAGWPADIELALEWYERPLERIYDDAAVRRGDLVQLRRIAATYASRERFLTEVTLDPPEATSDVARHPSRDDDYLILSTIHSAKGQEWKSVYVLNVVDGCIPSDLATGSAAEIDEERRLLYVAMTRAKDRLELIVPQRFYVREQAAAGDRHVYALPSRFIADVPMSLFDSCVWPEVAPGVPMRLEDAGARASTPTIDLAARMREVWRTR